MYFPNAGDTYELAKENGMSENHGDPASAQAKWLEYFKVPGVDTKALLESHDRNIGAYASDRSRD